MRRSIAARPSSRAGRGGGAAGWSPSAPTHPPAGGSPIPQSSSRSCRSRCPPCCNDGAHAGLLERSSGTLREGGRKVTNRGSRMTELQQYLAEEVAEDHADGIITRREAI